jgi:hypothetical protein
MDFDYFIIGVYSLAFLAVAETLGIELFWRFLYLIGIKVYDEVIDLPSPSPQINLSTVIKMEEGKFKFISLREVLFTSRIHPFKFFRISTPLPFKIRVSWKNNQARISARLPIGSTLFLLAVIAFWTYGSIQAGASFFDLFGFLFIFGLIVFSFSVEKKRMKEMIAELILILKTES